MQRSRFLNTKQHEGKKSGVVVYWMSRDQRSRDNYALLRAIEQAKITQSSVVVIFTLSPTFLDATLRHYDFMLKGLAEVSQNLSLLHIPFVILVGDPVDTLPNWLSQHHATHLICDFSPLKIARNWRDTIAQKVSISVEEVDTHNIVPAWITSQKMEIGARTLRSKINALLPKYLTEIPATTTAARELIQNENQKQTFTTFFKHLDTPSLLSQLTVDTTVKPVMWIQPGESPADRALSNFVQIKLPAYHLLRNDPTVDGQSDLSPYLHFGQLSPQRVALTVQSSKAPEQAKEAFLDELIVRRELAENFCFYNSNYDNPNCFPDWATKSLKAHQDDPKEFIYSLTELEYSGTHDELWNAAQMEMVIRGKMHGYMRMYWGKKILEWSKNPAEAMKHAIYLNDKYQLDGRDPNGYAGIAWSVGGVHDKTWVERPIFGVIRYMNRSGADRKFDVAKYIAKVNEYAVEFPRS